jgi:hypothetical protein
MDPISAALGITSLVGLGFKIAGTTQQVGAAQSTAGQLTQLGYAKAGIGAQEAAASAQYSATQTGEQVQQIGYEQQVEQQRRTMMELSSQRQSMENLRQTQQIAARGKAAAANQGAIESSGYGGGRGETAASGGVNVLGLSNALEVGRNTFDLNALISQNRIQQAYSKLAFNTQQAGFQTSLSNLGGMESAVRAQGQAAAATAQGMSNLGGDIMSAAGPFAKLSSGANPTPGVGGGSSFWNSPNSFAAWS